MRKRIGECLIQAGVITQNDLHRALVEQERTGERVGTVLVRLSLATELHVARALAFQLGFPFVDLAETPPDPAAVALIPRDLALRRACLGLRIDQRVLTVAMADPLLFSLVQDLELQTGHRIRQVVATRGDIVDAIEFVYADDSATNATATNEGPAEAQSPEAPAGSEAEAARSDLAERVIREARESAATDVHVEPTEEGVLIRHRIDGVLKEAHRLPLADHDSLVAQLKTRAGMDVSEHRRPQDGRIRVEPGTDAGVDFRVSSIRTVFGEKIVLRRVERLKELPPLDALGLSDSALEALRALIGHDRGVVLVAGPAGSGRTTTLCAAVSSLRSERTDIVTIERAVEYRLAGVSQTQLDEQVGVTFASAMRSLANQDADVVLVGDMPDLETTKLAMQSALTGRLVLAAFIADDAASCASRLIEMGGEASELASTLVGIVAQRLVRRLCPHCRVAYAPDADVLQALNLSDANAAGTMFFRAVGCDRCDHTGYRGRIGVFEILRVTDAMRRLIASGALEGEIREAAVASGMATLAEDALAKVKAGATTVDEMRRVISRVRGMRALCPQCGTAVAIDFNACPHCGSWLTGGCAHCGRTLQPGWNYCPYCARSAETRRPPARPTNVAEFKK